MHGSFPGHSNFEEHRSSPGTKSFFPGLLFPGALALSLRPVGMVAPAPASHSGYAPGEEWSSLERLRCHSRLKQSLRLSLPWQRGGYYLQSPLLSGPGASQTGSGDSLAATLEKMPVSLQINLPVEKALGFPQCLCKQYSVLCRYWKFLGVSSSSP